MHQNCTISVSGPPAPVPSLQPPVTDVGPPSLLWHGQLSVTNPGCVTTTRVMPTHSSTTIRAGVFSEKAIHTEKNEAADLVPHKPDAAHGRGWLGGAGPVRAGGGTAAEGSNTSSLPSSPTTL